jgi:hypothetical protein
MKRILPTIVLLVFLFSCEKDTPLLPQYESIIGTWDNISISYDSSGVGITKESPYKDLIIETNLNYEIYTDKGDLQEKGSIEIITQTLDRLELYFAAERPAYSSYAGSYVFGFTNVELVSLTRDELDFITINAAYDIYSETEIHLKK